MNRHTLPGGLEDALLLRAEHFDRLGDTSEAVQYRRFARQSRRMKLGNFRMVERRGKIW